MQPSGESLRNMWPSCELKLVSHGLRCLLSSGGRTLRLGSNPILKMDVSFYSKSNQMHNISNLFYFGTTLYMFRTVFPSIIRSPRLYIQQQVYVIQVLWLLASGNEKECRMLQNKMNLRYCASCWFYYRTILLCRVLQTSDMCLFRIYFVICIREARNGPIHVQGGLPKFCRFRNPPKMGIFGLHWSVWG